MNNLINFGISDDDLDRIKNIFPYIDDISPEEIHQRIYILSNIGCKYELIKKIISSNPFYLDMSIKDIKSLLIRLIELGFTNLPVLFDANPNILSIDVKNLNNYLEKHMANKSFDEIIKQLEENPYLFDEI